MPIRVPSGSERAPLQHMCVFERFCLNWANSAVDGFGNPICKFVRLPWNNNKDVSMLVSRFLFLLILRSEHSCLGSENWGRILSASLLPREFTANTAFSGTSMPSRIKSSWEFQPHTLYVCMYVCMYVVDYFCSRHLLQIFCWAQFSPSVACYCRNHGAIEITTM